MSIMAYRNGSPCRSGFFQTLVDAGKATPEGFTFRELPKNAAELNELSSRCGKLTNMLMALHAAFLMHIFEPKTGSRVKFNFREVDGRWEKGERTERMNERDYPHIIELAQNRDH